MTSITVRNLNETIKTGLRLRAARHGWSMEQEVRNILQQAVATEQAATASFAERILQRFQGLDMPELSIPPRQPMRTPPRFDAP